MIHPDQFAGWGLAGAAAIGFLTALLPCPLTTVATTVLLVVTPEAGMGRNLIRGCVRGRFDDGLYVDGSRHQLCRSDFTLLFGGSAQSDPAFFGTLPDPGRNSPDGCLPCDPNDSLEPVLRSHAEFA